MASQDWFEKDFYAVLGVKSDADDKEIKKTYRKLARQYHPDNHPGDTAAEQRFKEVGEAYAVLSDAEQRQQYDAIRAMRSGGPRFSAGGSGGPGAGAFEDVFSNLFGAGSAQSDPRYRTTYSGGGGDAPDLEDLLSMFGQGGGFSPSGQPGGFGTGTTGTGRPGGFSGPRKGRDIPATATMTFRQTVNGDTVVVNGVGGQSITARIPAGVKDGATIRLRGKGEPSRSGGEPGDLLLKVAVRPHEVFGRDGDNLTIDIPVTFAEAALGATISVPTLGGPAVKVKLPSGTPSGRVLRVKGRGVPRKDGAGDLLVRVLVTVPQRLTDEARAAISALQAQEAGFDPRAEAFRKARSE